MIAMQEITMLITTMGKPSLGACLRHYLAHRNVCSLIVVDFAVDLSDALGCYSDLDGKVNIIEVIGQKHFNKSAAINMGFAEVQTDYLIVCDADVIIEPSTITEWALAKTPGRLISLERVIESDGSGTRSGPGICCCATADFSRLGGYSSDYIGWGFEDHDFISRAQRLGIAHTSSGVGTHLSHSDAERTQYYYSHDKQLMREVNKARFETRYRQDLILGTLLSDPKKYPHKLITRN
jgi:glycosyltransferase involved in cell wall biosynthesis